MKTAQQFAQLADETALQQTSQALEAKGVKVIITNTLQEAKEAVLALVPKQAEVFTATSVTLDKTGLSEVLNGNDYVSIRQKVNELQQAGKKLEARRMGSASEYALGSVHGITHDGDVVIASATGSQIPNYAYGAEHIIWVVGTQKIVKDLPQAFQRITEHTLPLEDVRAQEAYGIHSSINELFIYRLDPRHRATVVFINEVVGF